LGRITDRLFKKTARKQHIYDTVDTSRLPQHVAIIMDGNGRWARRRGLPRSAGHRAGVQRVRTIVRMSSDIGIRHLTLYAFSTENWKRPKDEVSILMKLLIEFLRNEIDELDSENVRLKTLGDTARLPDEVQREILRAAEKTADNTGLTMNIAINYGSREEIVLAVRRAMQSGTAPEEIDEAYLSSLLFTAGQPDPDLLIRTSGELRISNYLLYQLAYAELYFTDTEWPDFDEEAFAAALNDFAKRNRRFGGV